MKGRSQFNNSRLFNERLLNWEFNHFLEYGITARNIKISQSDLDIFNAETGKISAEIVKMPYTLATRDFQSKNIMEKDGELYIIDFQDALLAPRVYDLVSLLRDSYVELSNAIIDEAITYYAEKIDCEKSTIIDEFNVVTIQRKLKDAGRFVYIDKIKKNSDYLKFVPHTLLYVKNAFLLSNRFTNLYKLLIKYIPEWN